MLRRFTQAHPLVVDAVVVAGVFLLDWIVTDRIGLHGSVWEVFGRWWLPVNAITALALLLRRTRPAVPLALALLALPVVLVDGRGPLEAPFFAVVYAVAAYRSTRAAIVAAALSVAGVTALDLVIGRFDADRDWVSALVGVVIALLLGVSIGDRRRYLAAVLDRAAQLARERDQRALLAVAAERGRMAHELHDVIAHSLSVVVRLSDGADAVAETDPDRSREAVRQIGRVGRESLRDMRRLLGVLRDEESADLAPQPSLADLDPLLQTYRAAGLPVVVERSGDAELGAALQLVVFRAAQEGLTNALRYARMPSRVLVRLRLAETVEVEVLDDGAGGHAPSVGSGRGLIGLRERAAIHGGRVEAGPRDDLGGRGWRLLVRLAADGDAA